MPKRALVVDDSMLIRHTVCRFLEERGYEVESATNGLEALEVLKHTRPDIIISDIMMPRMNGTAFITELKKNPETAGTPIIVLAARQHGAENAEEHRANVAIYKDIDIVQQLERALLEVMPE